LRAVARAANYSVEGTVAAKRPLIQLAELGQSVWLDYIKRDLFTTGELRRLIDEGSVRGETSNPTIFEKAIAGSTLYDEDLRGHVGKGPAESAERLMVDEVRTACDVFRPLHDRLGNDGFVSIECSPRSADDTEATIVEARRLWSSVDRPNVMVKIPATAAGIPAIRRCLSEGININITLLFSIERYRQVMEAFLAALEARLAAGEPLAKVHSVASFFVSRVDTKVDKLLDGIVARGGPRAEQAKRIHHKIAIANAKLAYERFQKTFDAERWSRLAARGGNIQRPLWASTSTKNPALPDIYYVEALIAPNTVDTMPPETLAAYKDHGDPRVRCTEGLGEARDQMAELAALGIDIDKVTAELEVEGVASFAKSFDALLKAVGEKTRALR
jgi:transaldolase